MNKETLIKAAKFVGYVAGALIVIGLIKKYVLPKLPDSVQSFVSNLGL